METHSPTGFSPNSESPLQFILETWQSGGLVMIPLLLVAL